MKSAPRTPRFGWIPDLPDHRDHVYAAPAAILKKKLPIKVDLRAAQPPVYDQGRIGSCTANAIAAVIQFSRSKAHQAPDFVPSRLFIYYNERQLEGTVNADAGAQLRDGIKQVAKLGVPTEVLWSYADTPARADRTWPSSAKPAQRPPAAAYKAALGHQAISYQRLTRTLGTFQSTLAEGFPFVFGFSVYDSLYDAKGAPRVIVPLPTSKDRVLGGHAVVAVGYDDVQQVFIVRNSWGSKSQDKGYFYLPYAYLLDPGLSDDFWTIRLIEA